MPYDITSLESASTLFPIVAHRLWQEWWRLRGQTEKQVEDGLREALSGMPWHQGYAATQGGLYLGSALVIAPDMDERLNITPWVAGVFVEPAHRNKGIGAALVRHAARKSFDLGLQEIYLCATAANTPYYEKLGWKVLETEVGAKALSVLSLKK